MQIEGLEIRVITVSSDVTNLRQNIFDFEAKLKELQDLATVKEVVHTGENQEEMNAPTGNATLTNSSFTL